MPASNWHKKLLNIPCIQQAGLIDWHPIIRSSGSNQHVVITTGAGRWLVRFNQSLPGVDRCLEHQLLQQLQDYPWVPRLIDCDPDAGHLITEYIEQATWQKTDYQDPLKINQLAGQLNTLHQIPCEQTHTRLDQRFGTYLAAVQASESVCDDFAQQLAELEQLGFWSACRWLYHSDLNPGNLMGHDPVYLLDWEFAGQGHAILDWLIMEQESGGDLSAWYPADTDERWVEPLRRLIAGLMHLWKRLPEQVIPGLHNGLI